MTFYGFIVGLILFIINKKYQLNRLSIPRFFALFGFVIILPYILPFIIFESIFLLEGSVYITPFVLTTPLASIIIFTLYSYALGWVYNEVKKKTWWKLAIYITLFLILFLLMWTYMNLYLFISLGVGS